jgi:hypothetical protein
MQFLERGGMIMNKQRVNASVFEYRISYFNTEFEKLLTGMITCYYCIITAQTKVPANNENVIRDIFISKKYLKNIDFRRAHSPLAKYHFDKESSENNGRADIRILQIDPYINDEAYYIIECKRLDNDKQTGKTGLNGKYISNGIARFVSGKYTTYNHTAGMIGFVVSKMDIHENVKFINKLLNETFTDINTEKELTKKQITPGFEYSYYSSHKVRNTTKIIYHLMFDFSIILIMSNNNTLSTQQNTANR